MRSFFWISSICCLLVSCSSKNTPNSANTGGTPGSGGLAAGGASTDAGGSSGQGGITSLVGGSTTLVGGATASGAAGVAAGATSQGGLAGTTSQGGLAGTTSQGGLAGTTSVGGETSLGGVDVGSGGLVVGPGTYALPPPSQCHNQDDYQAEGCIPGDSSTLCGGKCNVINACSENETIKPGADTTFICPRFMLFSAEMMQAAIDDGNGDFNYAIVGHDVDRGGIDDQDDSTCCQCYQLVYAWPSPQNERQGQVNPDNPDPPASALNLPKPLIVQSFNTGATPYTFDVYMAAGGLGAHNACAIVAGSTSTSGLYMYTSYPEKGQPSQGGVKAVSLYPDCKTDLQWVTTESLSSETCQAEVAADCQQIQSSIPGLTEQSQNSCIETNSPDSPYHANWSVYAMKVECPQHLTEVTGCRLAPQGLPEVDRTALTAQQAAANPSFWAQSSAGQMYETTTMEDCCRPTCASSDNIQGRGLVADGLYNAFYSCDVNGVPLTEPE